MNNILSGLCILLAVVPHIYPAFVKYDEWSSVDFDYDTKQKEEDLRTGRLRPEEVVVYDAQLRLGPGDNETLFVTTPNLFNASPFSLSTVSNKTSRGGKLLVPYPDASWYNGDCNNTITSVYRIKLDSLERLWVLDSGMVNQLTGNATIVCPPQILVFDVRNNNTLIKRFQIPADQHYDDSLLINIELDILNSDGSDTMAYISDVKGYRMLVYSMKTDKSFAIDNPFFNPFPVYCFFRNINGVNFTLLDGLFSISIGPGSNSDRQVYFHSLSSAREGFANLSVVNDPKLSQDAFSYGISDVRGFHSSAEIMTPDGFLIFTNIEENSIMIWDSTKPYTPDNFVTMEKCDVRLQFVTGMQLLVNNTLLVTSTRYQNVLTNQIAKNEINYRVLVDLHISKYLERPCE